MVFKDRKEAGIILAQKIMAENIPNPYILGVARGGIVCAAEVASVLNAPLDIVICRKLGVPAQPEYGFGAISEGDVKVLDQHVVEDLHIEPESIEAVLRESEKELQRRSALYRNSKKIPDLSQNNVIIVDDGIATGVTIKAAVGFVKTLKPVKVFVAAPVSSQEAFEEIGEVADQVICLSITDKFYAVGQFYQDFPQVTDEEVIEILNTKRKE